MPAPLKLPSHKTKIICTIGPASRSSSKLQGMIASGMNIARLNCSHGELQEHAVNIRKIRACASKARRMVSIFMDLPGVKMRIGNLQDGSLMLKKGGGVILTTKNVPGTGAIIPVEVKAFSKSVAKGDIIFLNDGFIQLKVVRNAGGDVHCKVLIGGKLLAHKGINLPQAKLDIDPITRRDLEIVEFGLKHGVNIFGLSFIERPENIMRVREYARRIGHAVYLVAKIERRGAVERFDNILKVADAVMIARGDLGVEVPIQELPGIQKRLIQKANLAGRPVITATQMLESMTQNVRPTRAEVNDVANAILDGTDAVMLSEETAIGHYPVETVRMMAKIAMTTEHQREEGLLSNDEGRHISNKVAQASRLTFTDVMTLNAVSAARQLKARYILTPTTRGSTTRRISRFKPQCWVLSVSTHARLCEFLNFLYGVMPLALNQKTIGNPHLLFQILKQYHLVKKGDTLIVTERRLSHSVGHTDSLGIVTL